MKKSCYITVLTNEKYLPGLFVLAKSLQDVKSKFEFNVLIPNGKSELIEKVQKMSDKMNGFIHIITAPLIEMEFNEGDHYWNETFFKLRVFGLTQFVKIVFLDSDMLINANIDELFEKEMLSAVIAGKIAFDDYKDLNSGLMVIKPSKEIEVKLINLIQVALESSQKRNSFCGDQDVIQLGFPNWRKEEKLHLPEIYNAFLSVLNTLNKKSKGEIKFKDVKVIHFVGPIKPWEYSLKFKLRNLYAAIRERKFLTFKAERKYNKYLKQYKKIKNIL